MGLCSSEENRNKNINQNRLTVSSEDSQEEIKPIENRLSEKTKFDNVYNYYTISEKYLGKGATGIVREAKDKNNNKYAIKTVWKADIEQNECFKREINISLELDNENIVKCHEIYEDNTAIHLILEEVTGGDLFDHIIHSNSRKLSETEAMDLLLQMLKGLQYLHEEVGIAHRDIKPENFLLYNENNRVKLKLIDFGFSTYCKNGEKMTGQLGTPIYAAPEIYTDKEYTNKVDLWSCGVVLYNMVKGTQPFTSNIEKVEDEVLHKKIDFSGFDNPDLKSLCESLLERDPSKRYTAFQALSQLNFIIKNPCEKTVQKKFDPDIKHIMNLLYNDRTIIEELKSIYLSECNINILEKMYNDFTLTEINTNKEQLNNNEMVYCKNYAKAEEIIEFGINCKYSPNNLKERLKQYCEQKLVSKIKKQMVNVTKFFTTIIGSRKFIKKTRALNEFKKIDKWNLGWLNVTQVNNYFIDPIKKENIKTHLQKNDKVEFETFYKILNEYDENKEEDFIFK